ncbi:hypothetical protein NHX12_000857 [Muraenolepis orangiensis]|uniref:Axonemal dynein light intermediate polypeptide 1 n=1 Tax=Muraenolepis orangiensis TaxID=630683 RepID=A0A9Q0DZN0_9TELE|nr:hypothetical protein NHX12_000857 [Muraenolepis orangiensis]
MIPPTESLLKYGNPILANEKTDRKSPKVSPQQTPRSGPVPPPPKPKPPAVDANRQQADEILNSLFPPREWEDKGQLWVQHVSTMPCTRTDMVSLQGQLDARLQQQQALETGICPVRRDLYFQYFDELIRQVTINCAERGMQLLRVRDEIRMTVAAYQTVVESSMAFGSRKALQAQQGQAGKENQISDLEREKQDLERQVNEQKAKCEAVERRALERQQTEERKHGEDVQLLKRTIQQLKAQLVEVTSLY